MKISWTSTVRTTYFRVIDYLEKEWTKAEIENFVHQVEMVLGQIAVNPKMFEASKKKKNVRKGFITKHNTQYYRVRTRKMELELITFWDNRQDPFKLAYWAD